MQVSSWATILLSMSLEATSLLGVMASISSINRIQGAELCMRETTQQDVVVSTYCLLARSDSMNLRMVTTRVSESLLALSDY